MSYVYRVVAHCDRRDSGRCHGLLEVSSTQASSLARIHGRLHERGWLRTRVPGTPEGLADVCPGCQTTDERTVAVAAARANGRKPVAG